MRYLLKGIITLGVVAAGVATVMVLKIVAPRRPVGDRSGVSLRVKGNPRAAVKIVEFMDFSCPPCAAGSKMLKRFMAAHPQAIQIEMNYFPLHLENKALSARYAQCAAEQGQFWPMFDLLVERQAVWKSMLNPETAFQQMAAELKLNPKALQQCVAAPQTFKTILTSRQQGQAQGVESTPTYFINGKMVVGSQALAEVLKEIAAGKVKGYAAVT
ncbi:MAG: thioredoxin domain-containing protein [Candidatus Omnitrophica bacterium]|nr:thioredoxin domain-containing protein [Candidatus Omnitrophota bacterium]